VSVETSSDHWSAKTPQAIDDILGKNAAYTHIRENRLQDFEMYVI